MEELFLEMFRRFLPLLWSHQKPDERPDEDDEEKEIGIVSPGGIFQFSKQKSLLTSKPKT